MLFFHRVACVCALLLAAMLSWCYFFILFFFFIRAVRMNPHESKSINCKNHSFYEKISINNLNRVAWTIISAAVYLSPINVRRVHEWNSFEAKPIKARKFVEVEKFVSNPLETWKMEVSRNRFSSQSASVRFDFMICLPSFFGTRVWTVCEHYTQRHSNK